MCMTVIYIGHFRVFSRSLWLPLWILSPSFFFYSSKGWNFNVAIHHFSVWLSRGGGGGGGKRRRPYSALAGNGLGLKIRSAIKPRRKVCGKWWTWLEMAFLLQRTPVYIHHCVYLFEKKNCCDFPRIFHSKMMISVQILWCESLKTISMLANNSFLLFSVFVFMGKAILSVSQ